jgi:hypothetical protein
MPTSELTATVPVNPESALPVLSPILAAGLLLAALPQLARFGFPAPSATAVIDATGAGRTRGYAVRAALNAILPTLQARPGRPLEDRVAPTDTGAITRATLDYLIAHPGAVTELGSRREYSDGFRAHVLEQLASHPERDRAEFAQAVRVPRATLDDWCAAPADPSPRATRARPAADPAVTERIATLIDAWRRWQGGFSAFAAFARTQLAIPWGETRIGKALALHAHRRARGRPGRRPDEKALRGAFLTFFPGAQWTEDGSPITIDWFGQPFTFNVELVVDTDSGAVVGADVRPTENTPAVIAAYKDAVTTTGAPPLALNTDNATENDGPGMAETLGQTLHIHATPGRPQNDCHAEGAFGLFRQVTPPLVVAGETPREAAQAALTLLMTLWMRTLNHRPRTSRSGKTRVQLYTEADPTPEQIAQARTALADIERRHDQAEQTRRLRANPAVRALLDAVFEANTWEDPQRRLKDAIAGYPIDAVIEAIAIFEGKAAVGALPPSVDARYLLGIVRNLADEREGRAIAEVLWRRRLEVQDDALLRLIAERDRTTGDASAKIRAFTERAIDADSALQRTVWLDATAEAIRREAKEGWKAHFDHVTRLAYAAYRLRSSERLAIVRDVAARLVPAT